MRLYCKQKHVRGRPKTTLPVLLWQEASKVLKTKPTLTLFNEIAGDRHCQVSLWREFVERVIVTSFKVPTKKLMGDTKVACAKSKKEVIYIKKVSTAVSSLFKAL